MKKNILTAALLLLSVIVIHAQKTTFGIKGGVNSNTFYLKSEGTGGSDSRYSLTKPGFHFGGIANIQCSGNFSIQPQLLFVNKGGKITLDGDETEFNFYTIDLPINLLYHHNGFFVGAGPNFSYGVSAKGKAAGQPEVDLYEDDALGAGSSFNRFEIGANATMGYKFPSGFMLSTNYTPGFTDIYEEASGGTGSVKSGNSYWGFSIGYIFGSNKVATKK